MIEIYHHQTLWNNRTAPRVHRAFSQVLGSEKLWGSHDRASINPPSRDPDPSDKGLHWDADLEDRPVGFEVQGVLYLCDTPEEQGAFVCVPGFHKKLEDWRDRLTGRFALGGRYRKGRENRDSPTAELTLLARKLAGVDLWD